MKKILNYEQLNELSERVKSKNLTSRLDLKMYQDPFPRIVIGQGLKNSGKVRSYEESVKFLKRIYKDRYIEFTREEYEREIEKLNESLTGWKSTAQYWRRYRERIETIVAEANKDLSRKMNVKGIPTRILLEFVREAEKLSKADSHGSPKFYEYLLDMIADYRK